MRKKEEISVGWLAGRFGNEWKTLTPPLPTPTRVSGRRGRRPGGQSLKRARETTKTDLLRTVVSSLGFFGVAVGKGMEDADKRDQEQKGFCRVLFCFLLRPKTFTLFSPKYNDVVNVHRLRVTGPLISENRDLGFGHPINYLYDWDTFATVYIIGFFLLSRS